MRRHICRLCEGCGREATGRLASISEAMNGQVQVLRHAIHVRVDAVQVWRDVGEPEGLRKLLSADKPLVIAESI